MSGQSGTAMATVASDTPGDHTFKLIVDDGTDTTVAVITIFIDGGSQWSFTGNQWVNIGYDPTINT
jgi:hypothetical protein